MKQLRNRRPGGILTFAAGLSSSGPSRRPGRGVALQWLADAPPAEFSRHQRTIRRILEAFGTVALADLVHRKGPKPEPRPESGARRPRRPGPGKGSRPAEWRPAATRRAPRNRPWVSRVDARVHPTGSSEMAAFSFGPFAVRMGVFVGPRHIDGATRATTYGGIG
jgi:hypothetical protein